jgi:hypothetical protein
VPQPSKVNLQIPNPQSGACLCIAINRHECYNFAGFFKATGFMTLRSYAIHADPAILHT